MPSVDVPSLGVVDFPDSMSESDINSALDQHFKKAAIKSTFDAVNLPISIMTNPAVGEASAGARKEASLERLADSLRVPEDPFERTQSEYRRFGPGALGATPQETRPFAPPPFKTEGGTTITPPQGQIGLPSIQTGPNVGVPGKIAAGAYNVAAGAANFPLSLEGLAASLAAGVLPAPVTKAIFAGLMAKGAGEQAGKASVTNDPQDWTEALLTAGASGLLGKPEFERTGPVQGPAAIGEMLQLPKGAPVPRGEAAPPIERLSPDQAAAQSLLMQREATGEEFTPRAKGAPKPTVPESGAEPTPPEQTPGRENLTGLQLQIDQVVKANARTKEAIRKLFPEMNRQQAAELRDLVWKTKESINAPETRNEPGSVQQERGGDDEGGTPTGPKPGGSVPPKTPVSPPEAPGAAEKTDVTKATAQTEHFATEAGKPTFPYNNTFSIETGLAARSAADLSRLLEVRRAAEKASKDIEEKLKDPKLTPEEKLQLYQQAAAEGHKRQLASEAIQTATNTGSWVEGSVIAGTPLNLGERPLDIAKTPEAQKWLQKNAKELGLKLPDETKAPVSETVGRNWDEFHENLIGDLDTFSPARESKAGISEAAYALQDVADRFVEFAKSRASEDPATLFKDFSKSDDATPSQMRKLRASVKSVLSAEAKPVAKVEAPKTETQNPVVPDTKQVEIAPRGAIESARPVEAAADKVETHVEKVAATEGQRPAKEVKSELVSSIESSIEKAPTEADTIEPGYTTAKGKTVPAKDKAGKITIEIPGDGTFTVRNTKEALQGLLKRAQKISTADNTKPKISGPESPGSLGHQAEKIAAAYGSAEEAYRSAKRQRAELPDNDPETPAKAEAVDALIGALYDKTKAAELEQKAENSQKLAATYRDGAESFRKEIAKLEGLKKLTPRAKIDLNQLRVRLEENQKRLAQYEQEAEQFSQKAAKEKAALEQPKPNEAPSPKLQKLEDRLDQAAAEALKRVDARDKGTKFGSGVDPEHYLKNAKDYAIYGAAKLLKYGVRSAEWTGDMLTAFGNRIRPYLDDIYDAAKDYLERYKAEQPAGKPTSVQEIINAATQTAPARPSNVTQAMDTLQTMLRTARALKEHFTGQPKVNRAEVKLADDFLEADANRIRDSLGELVKNLLPVSERGRFVTAIANATKRSPILTGDPETMYKRAAQVAARIEERASEFRKEQAIDELKQTVQRALKSPTVDIGYKQRILETLRGVNFTKPTAETIAALQRTKEYLDRQAAAGVDVTMPREILDGLEVLTKTPIRDMPAHAVYALTQKIADLEQLGRLKVAARQEVWNARKEAKLGELSDEQTTPFEKNPELTHQPGDTDTISMKIGNVIRRAMNAAADVDMALLPIDAVMDMLGDAKGKYRGWLFRHVRGPLDLGFNEASLSRDTLSQPIVDLIKNNKMGQREAERIGTYAIAMQEGGVERLIEQGIDPGRIEEIVKGLTPQERQVYLAMRKVMDSQLPELQRLMHELYNIEVKPVENYFPMPRDWEKMREVAEPKAQKEPLFGVPMGFDELAGWRDMFRDFFPGKTTKTEQGMTIERKPKAMTPIRLNAFDTFYQHLNDVTYLLKTQRDLKMIGEMVRAPEFQEKYGKAGQALMLDFLDTFARQGRLGGMRRIPWMDELRTRTSAGIIGLRVASQFVHLSNLPFVIGRTGISNYKSAMAEIIGKPEAREWVERNFREALSRGGGEPAMVEAASKDVSVFGKTLVPKQLTRASFYIARQLDRYNSEAAMLGVYLKELKRKGIDPSTYMDHPIDREAQAYAMVLARRAIASPLSKDVPMALSRGALTGGNISLGRSLGQFQNIFLDQWSNIRHDLWKAGIRAKDPKQAAAMFLAVAGVVAAETGIRSGIAGAWHQITGAPQKKKEESPSSKVIREVARRFPGGGQITSALMYKETGIPMLDTLLETGQAAKTMVTTKNPRAQNRAIVKALGGAGQIMGIPGSGEISTQVLESMK